MVRHTFSLKNTVQYSPASIGLKVHQFDLERNWLWDFCSHWKDNSSFVT